MYWRLQSARPSISRSTAETAGEEQKEMEEQRETKIDEHKETGEARVEEEVRLKDVKKH